MARRYGTASQSGIATGAGTKTLVQLLAATNHAIAITEVSIGCLGTSNSQAPIRFELVRQSDAGTMTSLTPKKMDDSIADTLDTTAQHTATAEPTTGDVLHVFTVHPQTAQRHVFPVEGQPICGAGDRIAIRAVQSSGTDTNVNVVIGFEE